MPKVSVIIPVYNVEQYIERCARSLFEQTLDDIEYIFVNDCTPDKSMEVLARVLEDYPSRKEQVRIINMPVNSGQARVRRIGVDAATGDYIIHCDSDDWVEISIYEKMWSKAVNEKLDMVICGYFVSDGYNTLSTHNMSASGNFLSALIANEIENFTWNKLIRRELFSCIDEWPRQNLYEDVAIIIPIAYQCKRIGKIDEPLYFYFKNPGGICCSTVGYSRVLQMTANVDLAIRYIIDRGGEKCFRNEFLHRKCYIKINCWDLPWKDYMSIYPEIIFRLLFDPYLPLEKKLGHITKCLGIHGISRHI